jgi:hypothetical protein
MLLTPDLANQHGTQANFNANGNGVLYPLSLRHWFTRWCDITLAVKPFAISIGLSLAGVIDETSIMTINNLWAIHRCPVLFLPCGGGHRLTQIKVILNGQGHLRVLPRSSQQWRETQNILSHQSQAWH